MRRRTWLLVGLLALASACSRECGAPDARPAGQGSMPVQQAPPTGGEETVVDPYCGMRMRPGEAAVTKRYQGRTYYFCLQDHMEAFFRDPDRYLADSPGDYGPESLSDAQRSSDSASPGHDATPREAGAPSTD